MNIFFPQVVSHVVIAVAKAGFVACTATAMAGWQTVAATRKDVSIANIPEMAMDSRYYFYRKDTKPLYQSFMCSLVSLLSGIYRQSPVKTPDIKTSK